MNKSFPVVCNLHPTGNHASRPLSVGNHCEAFGFSKGTIVFRNTVDHKVALEIILPDALAGATVKLSLDLGANASWTLPLSVLAPISDRLELRITGHSNNGLPDAHYCLMLTDTDD